MEIRRALESQRAFFDGNRTRDLNYRKGKLRALREVVQRHEAKLLEALRADLGKPPFESYVGEVAFLYDEIKFTLKNLDRWARPRRVRTPLLQAPASSWIYSEPLGIVLIIGPWNYPLQLMVAPLIGAIAAGNLAVLKPSELAPATAEAIARMIPEVFSPEEVVVYNGGAEVTQKILAERFDHIFFTGGLAVGKIVLQAAAQYLTPVTLELGGKSPCIVDKSVDLDVTARRIVWGKFFNAGQTCVAPDYLFVPRALKQPLLDRMKKEIVNFFGSDPVRSRDFARIINQRHFDRLIALIDPSKVATGGKSDRPQRYIEPTLLTSVATDDKIMQDEIFGPLLPILEYDQLDEAIGFVNSRPKPLAFYFFSNDKTQTERVLGSVPFGGGCVNDTLIHLGNPHLPFGGVGESGMGAYHGQFGFDTFSHRKSVTKRSFLFDVKMRYPPYRDRLEVIKKWLK